MKRAGLLAASLVATATLAHADKKLQDLTPGFVKEAASCVVEARGLTHIVGGVATLASTLQGDDKAALDADLATLTAANARVTTWCTALDEIVAFLQVNEAAPYKRVQRELDGKYRAVVAARTAAKKSLTDITPVTRAVIPRIKRTATEAPVPTAAATAFPSKRAVVLPRLPGSWTVSGSQTSDTATYADRTTTATVTTRRFDGGTCDAQREKLIAKATGPVHDLEPPADAKEVGVQWSLRFTLAGATPHTLLAMCTAASPYSDSRNQTVKGVIVTSDITPVTNKSVLPDLTKLMVEMLGAQLGKEVL